MSVVTHSHQTPLEILDEVGSRDIFNFISSGKTFGVCLMVPSNPWFPWGQLPCAGGPWGEQHSPLPPQAPGHPQARSPPEGWRGPSTQEVLSNGTLTEKRPGPAKCAPGAVPVLSWILQEGQSRHGLRQKWGKQGRVGESGLWREGCCGVGGPGGTSTCCLSLECLQCSHLLSTGSQHGRGEGWGQHRGFQTPPAGRLLLLAPLLSHPWDHSSPRATQGVWPV